MTPKGFSEKARLTGEYLRSSLNFYREARTECNEIMEPFSKKQKGSSAMPHKRNPIVTERMTGFSRLLRSNAMAALEGSGFSLQGAFVYAGSIPITF